MLMVNFHTDSEMSLLSFRLFENQVARFTEIPLEMAPNSAWAALMVLSRRYQASAFAY
jgi:hypothetical protein